MERTVRNGLGVLLIVLIVGLPFAYMAYRETHIRNFRVVDKGVLYRSGALSIPKLKRMIEEYQLKTIVSFRAARREGDTVPEMEEELFCQSIGIKYVRIQPRTWSTDDTKPPAGQIGVDEFLAVVNDPKNHPILMHCFAGSHRTGVHAAIYRMEKNKWTNDEAIAEMRRLGYVNIDKEDDVRAYLVNYVPTWKKLEKE